MNVFDILTLILGLSLFLFGMNLMGDTLKKSAGRKLKLLLGKLAGSPLKGLGLGFIVTAVIQSSSAATVMVVGFVNSGVMQLSQAIAVIMGANVGTTVTSWLTALSGIDGGSGIGSVMQWFKPTTFTPVLALIGILLFMVSKSDKRKNVGTILLGFSVLMMGMETMSDAVGGLAENAAFRSILLAFENPILGVLAGAVMTAVVQSSSASIGILQSFTATGAITFGNAVPIIMGQNIGTCVTAMLSSAGTGKNAKRAATVHLLFNVFGTVICLIAFYAVRSAFDLKFLNGSIDMWGIAIIHTVFNLLTVAVLLPMSRLLERLAVMLVRDKNATDELSVFDERLLATPSVAIERSREGTIKMAEVAKDSLSIAATMLLEGYDEKTAEKIKAMEKTTDAYEDKLGTYLVRISEQSILESEKKETASLLHFIGDLERIADHAVNIAEASEEINDKGVGFTENTQKELAVLIQAINEIGEMTVRSVCENNVSLAKSVEALEQVVDGLCEEIKRRHIQRLQSNECTVERGFVLSDILTDLERVSDHYSNIAGCLVEISEHRSFDMHANVNKFKAETEEFKNGVFEYSSKYRLD